MARRSRRPAPRVVFEEVAVPMPDGARLAADVVRVDDDVRRPALLLRTPYLRAGARATLDLAGLAREGWAVVCQDTRGRGDSEGSAEPFVSERADGAATIAWCAGRRWCDGRVAMTGGSYLGFAQWQAAAACPPQLRAISPSVAPDDLFQNWHYEGGAFCTGLVTNWNVMMALLDPAVGGRARARVAELARDVRGLLHRPHADQPLRTLYPPYAKVLDPADRRYWRQFDLRRRYARMDVAAIQLAGWYDVFLEGGLRNFRAMREQAASEYARASQRLIIGPWVHAGLLFRMTPEMDFGLEANGLVDGTMPALYRWLRDAVDGREVQGGARVFVVGRGAWVELDEWPPPSTPLELWLTATAGARSARGDGRLATAPAPPGSERFLHDPHDPVPTRGGRILGPWLPVAGPSDQRPVEERDDVLVFTSAALHEPLTVMGTVSAHVEFETTGRSADVTAKLVDVHPDGRAMGVVDSVRRSPFVPGRAKRVEVVLGSIAHEFGRGHRIRLELASSNFPRFDVNPSTGAPPLEVDRYEPALQTLHHGGRTGSRLVLPVVEGRPPR